MLGFLSRALKDTDFCPQACTTFFTGLYDVYQVNKENNIAQTGIDNGELLAVEQVHHKQSNHPQ